LTNSEGNHGEDVKEYYFYLDSSVRYAWRAERRHPPGHSSRRASVNTRRPSPVDGALRPSASALRHGFREVGPDNETFILFENLMDSKGERHLARFPWALNVSALPMPGGHHD
jgi:hypothetical protein